MTKPTRVQSLFVTVLRNVSPRVTWSGTLQEEEEQTGEEVCGLVCGSTSRLPKGSVGALTFRDLQSRRLQQLRSSQLPLFLDRLQRRALALVRVRCSHCATLALFQSRKTIRPGRLCCRRCRQPCTAALPGSGAELQAHGRCAVHP